MIQMSNLGNIGRLEKRCIIFGLCMYLIPAGISQNLQYKALHIGDSLPNLILNLNANNSAGKVSISEFRGKVILFDFWDSHCITCVAHMPLLATIQEKLNDKAKVIMVTKDSEETISKMWKDLEMTQAGSYRGDANKLSKVFSDSILSSLFPASVGFPMHVWIDSGGVYRGSSYDNTTTIENLSRFWGSHEVELATYNSNGYSLKTINNWFATRFNFSDHLLSYSLITKNDEEVPMNVHVNTMRIDSLTKKAYEVELLNQSIEELFSYVYFHGNRTIRQRLQEKVLYLNLNTATLVPPPSSSVDYIKWARKNTYCFAARVRVEAEETVFNVMKREISKYFRINSRLENKSVKCLVLSRSSNYKMLLSGNKVSTYEITYDTLNKTRRLKLTNQPVETLMAQIYSYYLVGESSLPLVDEIYSNSNIDLDIPWGENDYSLSTLRRVLHTKGIEIKMGYRKIRVLVLAPKLHCKAASPN